MIEEDLKLSAEEFRERFDRKRPTTETELIFHCKGGGRAGRATEKALKLGFVKYDFCYKWLATFFKQIHLISVLKATKDHGLTGQSEKD